MLLLFWWRERAVAADMDGAGAKIFFGELPNDFNHCALAVRVRAFLPDLNQRVDLTAEVRAVWRELRIAN